MKVIFKICIISLIVLEALHGTFAAESCNEYVDGILRDLKEDKEYFQDPYDIPEKNVEVHKKVVFVNYTGEASIYDGHIFGMSTLHRDGDVIVDKSKKTHLKIWLGAGELNMKCNGKLKLMGHGPQMKVDAKITYVNMKLDIVPTETGSNPKVTNFKIEAIKGLDVKVSGMGPLNFFMNSYMKIIGALFKNLIRSGIEDKLKVFMTKKLKNYEIPEDCLNNVYRRNLYKKV